MKTSRGYRYQEVIGHPRASRYHLVPEHILVVEKAMGKFLVEGHPVHHVDENRGNNVNTNLVACEDQTYHTLLHRRTDALKACGNPDARRCKFCQSYDRQEDIKVARNGQAYHRDCAKEYFAAKWRGRTS
jgi:hypothetical protein